MAATDQGGAPPDILGEEGAIMRSIALVLAFATAALVIAQTSSTYRVTHTYTLGGDGSWDYVVPDPPSHRLYIARQNRVMVVDEDKGTVIGEVSGINGAHGAAKIGRAHV